jgi:hypothetical protein
MELEIHELREQDGVHIGDPECSSTTQAELRRMHALGFNTIWANDYEMLVSAGFEPDQFLKIWPVWGLTHAHPPEEPELESLV